MQYRFSYVTVLTLPPPWHATWHRWWSCSLFFILLPPFFLYFILWNFFHVFICIFCAWLYFYFIFKIFSFSFQQHRIGFLFWIILCFIFCLLCMTCWFFKFFLFALLFLQSFDFLECIHGWFFHSYFILLFHDEFIFSGGPL